jgi:hypothetical protein
MDTFADRMARQRKRKAPLGWWLTVAQIRREFRNVYPTHEKLPPQLRALANELDKITTGRRKPTIDSHQGHTWSQLQGDP